jgi:hypothetical protein
LKQQLLPKKRGRPRKEKEERKEEIKPAKNVADQKREGLKKRLQNLLECEVDQEKLKFLKKW